MNENFKTPKIRFKGFTEDWEQRKLGEIIIDTIDNRGKNPPYYCESGIPIIDNFMIKNNGYPNLKIATRYLDDYLFNNFVRKYNELDDTLITLVGNGIGNIALFPKEKSAIIQNTLGMRFEEPKKFKYYSLLSKNNQIIKLDRGMAQPSIRQDELKDIDIELPIFDEQLKISRLMSNLDNLITLHQRKYDKLVNIKKSMLEKMFPKNDSKIPEIRFKGFTEDWEQRKLENLFDKGGSGGTPSSTNDSYYNGNIPFLSISDITNSNGYIYDTEKRITDLGLKNSSAWIVPAESLSLAMYASVGKLAILKVNSATSQAFYNMIFNSLIYRDFVFHRLDFANIKKEWEPYISTGTQSNLNAEKVRNFEITISKKNEEILKINKLLNNIDNLITLHQRKLDKLNNFKKSMLEKMFV